MWRTRRNPTQVGRKTYLPLKANTVSVLVDYLNRKSNPWRACAYISDVLVFHDIHPSLPPHFQAALLVREGGGFKDFLTLLCGAINLSKSSWTLTKNLNGMPSSQFFPGKNGFTFEQTEIFAFANNWERKSHLHTSYSAKTPTLSRA